MPGNDSISIKTVLGIVSVSVAFTKNMSPHYFKQNIFQLWKAIVVLVI